MTINHEELIDYLTKNWAGKTLEAFRKEAQKEANGTVFEAMRVAGGQRLMIIVCVTGPDQLSLLEKRMDLHDEIPPADWSSLTLGDMATRTINGKGLSYEDLRDSSGKRIALALCATDAKSTHIIETIFNL